MKTTILIINITLSLTVFARPRLDTESYQKKICEMDSTLSAIQSNFNSINDSLKTEIDKYQAREDYLSVSLEDQASRFSLIVTGLLALAALLSFTGYKIEITRLNKIVEKQLEVQKLEFEQYKSKIENIDSHLRSSSANTFVSIAMNFEKEGSYALSLYYFISAATDHSRSTIISKELKKLDEINKDDCKTTLANLKAAKDLITKIKSDSLNNQIIILEGIKSDVLDNLNQINELKQEDVIDLVAATRVEFKSLFSDASA